MMLARSDLREVLIASALSMLEGGDDDLGLRAVAREAGVSAMAPYRHFADHGDLLNAVAEQGFMMLQDALLAADQSVNNGEALLSQGNAYLAFARAHPALFRLMFSTKSGRLTSGTRDGMPGPGDAYKVMKRRAENLVPDNPDTAALSCWSIVHGLATLALDGRLEGIDQEREGDALKLFVLALNERPVASVKK